MKLIHLLQFFLFLILPVCTTTPKSFELQSDTKYKREGTKVESYASSLLWKVEGDVSQKLNSRVILFGTIHGGVDPKKDLDPKLYQEILSGIKMADTIYFEIDLSQKLDKQQMSNLFYSGKETLEEKLNSKDWSQLKKQLIDIPVETLKKMRPITVFMTLMQKALNDKATNEKSNAQQNNSIDAFIFEQALSQNKKLEFLETPDFQLSLMNNLITIDDLSEIINSKIGLDDHLGKLIEIYKSQNIEKIYQSFEDDYKSFEKNEKWLADLVINRNRAWMPKIEKCLNSIDQICFFAFGAGHLAGAEGVLALLEKNNWRVRPYQENSIE